MLVFGDHYDIADAEDWLNGIASDLADTPSMAPGIERHAKLVSALIEAGRLQQGVEDTGVIANSLSTLVRQLARCVTSSFDSGFQETGTLPAVPHIDVDKPVRLKLPEGFSFYAVYPEAYIAAARQLRLVGAPRVIGIRSIGTTLGAVAAEALDAPRAIMVRPTGDPFARRADLPEAILDPGAHYVIVDEGPGLSGSSFGAVADWLEERRVPLERIAFLPSHGGKLGPEASRSHRARWATTQRVAAEFDTRLLAELFGPLQPFWTGEPWERLKFFGRSSGSKVLLKFAGLGRIGERKYAMAQALHGAGLAPKPVQLVHGFLVERWRDDARPLHAGDKPVDEIGHYIGTRARLFPEPDASGASIEDLVTMCRRNLALTFGEQAAAAVDRWRPAPLAAGVTRVRTDNKMDREEWLRLPGGRLLKTDAVDHHVGHDLIGCQDTAWDVAGAIVEFGLDRGDEDRLVAATEGAAGRRVDLALLEFCRLAYCCFRLGQARLAGQIAGETERTKCRFARYETTITALL